MTTYMFLKSLPPYIPISFGVVSGLLILWGISRTITNFRRWRVMHNQTHPELNQVIATLWNMHLTLGELASPADQKNLSPKLINSVSIRFTDLLGLPKKNGKPNLKLNVFTYARLIFLLGGVYRINPKKLMTLARVSADIGHLMDESGVGISVYMKHKKYKAIRKEYDCQTLLLNIKPETSLLIDRACELSFGLHSVRIVGRNMLRQKKFALWLGNAGVKFYETFLTGTDGLYKASLFEIKESALRDLAENP